MNQICRGIVTNSERKIPKIGLNELPKSHLLQKVSTGSVSRKVKNAHKCSHCVEPRQIVDAIERRERRSTEFPTPDRCKYTIKWPSQRRRSQRFGLHKNEAFPEIEKVLADYKSNDALEQRPFSVGGIVRDQSNDNNNHFSRGFVLNQVHATLKLFVKQRKEKQIENDREVSGVNPICHIFDL
jgi:hypothetical protein